MSSNPKHAEDQGVIGDVARWLSRMSQTPESSSEQGRFYQEVQVWLGGVQREIAQIRDEFESADDGNVARENAAAAISRIAEHTTEAQGRLREAATAARRFRKTPIHMQEGEPSEHGHPGDAEPGSDQPSPSQAAPEQTESQETETVAQMRARLRAEHRRAAEQAAADRRRYVESIRQSVQSLRNGQQDESADPVENAIEAQAPESDPQDDAPDVSQPPEASEGETSTDGNPEAADAESDRPQTESPHDHLMSMGPTLETVSFEDVPRSTPVMVVKTVPSAENSSSESAPATASDGESAQTLEKNESGESPVPRFTAQACPNLPRHRPLPSPTGELPAEPTGPEAPRFARVNPAQIGQFFRENKASVDTAAEPRRWAAVLNTQPAEGPQEPRRFRISRAG